MMASAEQMSMAMPVWLVHVLGVIGIFCFAMMLSPQVYKNFRSQSTDGLSVPLVVLWHVAAVLSTAYFAAQPVSSISATFSIAVFAACCGVLESQMVAYRPSRKSENSERSSCLVVIGVSTVLIAVSAAVGGAFFALFRAMPADATYVVGNVLPSILLGAGFLPQMYEFASRKSTEGYSFGVTALDVVGSSANVAVAFAPAGVAASAALKEAAPFLTIIVMHVVLVTLAAIIKCCCSEGKDAGSPNKEAGNYVDSEC